MGLRHRFLQSAASVLIDHYLKQETLAADLRMVLKYDEKLELRTVVSRFMRGDIEDTGYFEGIPLLFAREIVEDDYPYYFVKWFDDAAKAYDLASSSGKRDVAQVRRVLAEVHLWIRCSEADQAREPAPYARLGAVRPLALGLAIGVEQRVLGTSEDRKRFGLEQLKDAIGRFRALKPRDESLSPSDKFHIALAVHMFDWLLSELEDKTVRAQMLAELPRQAIDAFAWLAELTQNWAYVYNVAEIYGAIGDVSARRMLTKAIDLNPRLALFGLATTFDGLDEPLSNAPALTRVLPEIQKSRSQWLALRADAYQQHAVLYREDVNKGIKAMRKTVKAAEQANGRGRRGAKALGIALALAIAAAFAWVPDIAMACTTKPIF